MVPESSSNFFAGIPLTQFGDPRAHRQKGVRDSIRCDRLVAFGTSLAVSETEDHEVGEPVLMASNFAEARIDANGAAEAGPEVEGGVAGTLRFLGVGSGCDVESSPEVSAEAVSGAKVCRRQGCGCG